MEPHFNLSDDDFLQQFREGTLSSNLFTHTAHLRLAFLHLKKLTLIDAMESIKNDIKNYVKTQNAEDKYNETLTIAAIKAIHHFMQRSPEKSFIDLIAEYPRLKNNFKQLLLFHYSPQILFSEEAKNTFLEPDVIPF